MGVLLVPNSMFAFDAIQLHLARVHCSPARRSSCIRAPLSFPLAISQSREPEGDTSPNSAHMHNTYAGTVTNQYAVAP